MNECTYVGLGDFTFGQHNSKQIALGINQWTEMY